MSLQRHRQGHGVDTEFGRQLRSDSLRPVQPSIAVGTSSGEGRALDLFAVDELAGFIVACCKVRPNGITDLEPSSVKKKLKDKAFAAAVSRKDIKTGIAELGPVAGVDETQHIQICIQAIRAERERLGL